MNDTLVYIHRNAVRSLMRADREAAVLRTIFERPALFGLLPLWCPGKCGDVLGLGRYGEVDVCFCRAAGTAVLRITIPCRWCRVEWSYSRLVVGEPTYLPDGHEARYIYRVLERTLNAERTQRFRSRNG